MDECCTAGKGPVCKCRHQRAIYVFHLHQWYSTPVPNRSSPPGIQSTGGNCIGQATAWPSTLFEGGCLQAHASTITPQAYREYITNVCLDRGQEFFQSGDCVLRPIWQLWPCRPIKQLQCISSSFLAWAFHRLRLFVGFAFHHLRLRSASCGLERDQQVVDLSKYSYYAEYLFLGLSDQ